jgi:REP element-mobilizing transposase RayT
LFMSRTLRGQLPGMAFHITARVQAKQPLFEKHESVIERIIIDGVRSSDARLLSATVMPNHFHVVLRQGARPLGWVMQPIMRRIALRVQKLCEVEDHVFGAPYFSAPIENADYARAAIIYTNSNPVRAKICDDPAAYLHSTHRRLMTPDADATAYLDTRDVLELFADHPGLSIDELRVSYLACMQWRLEKDVYDDLEIPFDKPCPKTRHGDRHFATRFVALAVAQRKPTKDLRDRAIEILKEIDATTSIELLRRRTLPRRLVEMRDQLIAGLLQARYRGKAIAAYFGISESAVSKIATRLRYGPIS